MVIISHKYKFIFFRPRKVAGTSIEKSIEDFLLLNNDMSFVISKFGYNIYLPENILTNNKIDNNKLYIHVPPKYIKKLILNEKFDNYCKIIIIRNPYDMVISWFWWIFRNYNFNILSKIQIINKFQKFVIECEKNNKTNFNKYFYNNDTKYDFILKYENLENDIKKLNKLLNINIINNYNLKNNIRKKNIKIKDFYNKKIINIINKKFDYVFKIGNYNYF